MSHATLPRVCAKEVISFVTGALLLLWIRRYLKVEVLLKIVPIIIIVNENKRKRKRKKLNGENEMGGGKKEIYRGLVDLGHALQKL